MFGKSGRRNGAGFLGAADGAAASFIEILLCKSAFKAALNSGRGKSRRERTRVSILATLGLGRSDRRCCGRASMALMTRSSCSAGERLGMATLHLRAESLQRAELQLLDGSLGLLQACGDFADGALVDEALVDDAPLCGGKFVH